MSMLGNSAQLLSIAGWVGVAVVMSFVGLFVLRRVKAWTQQDSSNQVFTIQDLREMHARGDISDAEFENMRAAILASFGQKPARKDPDGGENRGPAATEPPQPD